jgi:hypothetical protein
LEVKVIIFRINSLGKLLGKRTLSKDLLGAGIADTPPNQYWEVILCLLTDIVQLSIGDIRAMHSSKFGGSPAPWPRRSQFTVTDSLDFHI